MPEETLSRGLKNRRIRPISPGDEPTMLHCLPGGVEKWIAVFVFHFALLACAVCAAAGDSDENETPQETILRLRGEIARHDELYFRDATAEIGDLEYDRLKEKLALLEKRFPGAAATGTKTDGIGNDHIPGFARQAHRAPMLSLDKTYEDSGVRAFCDAAQRAQDNNPNKQTAPLFWIEPKYDGLAVSAVYENGKLVRVVTRGDGHSGDDVTANARALAKLPPALAVASGENAAPELVEIRGEVFTTWDNFEKQNRLLAQRGNGTFSNPRNFAAGSLKLRDSTEVHARGLSVVFYGIGALEPKLPSGADTQEALLRRLHTWGLPVPEKTWSAHDAEGALVALRELARLRAKLPFPVDGGVIKINPFSMRLLFADGPTAPRWALAFKFAPERTTTILRAITLQTGHTGRLTPVAELEPVRLGGVMVRRASLHNPAEIARLGLRTGDTVFVERRGDVIPGIAGVDLSRRAANTTPFIFPDKCAACGGPIIVEAGGVVARHDNTACPERIAAAIRHFASRPCMNISGMGPATAGKLVAAGLVRNLPDLYHLSQADLVERAGMGRAAAAKLLAALERSKRAEPWRVLTGIGVEGIGAEAAHKLTAHFGSVRAVAETAAAKGALEGAGINAAAARKLQDFFAIPENRAFAEIFSPAAKTNPGDVQKSSSPSRQKIGKDEGIPVE
ncbi:MAG: NAD-dependent DNA ligase LigA [Puniceicoccales bacterium]|jgi:DNA ligase (NAD+)|nr:NAD-dependent DNA ligase LigA [Puniceicoccales bacterium]